MSFIYDFAVPRGAGTAGQTETMLLVCAGSWYGSFALIRSTYTAWILSLKGPRTQIIGFTYHSISGFWAPKPYDLGPWTLRGRVLWRSSGLAPSLLGLDPLFAATFSWNTGFCRILNRRVRENLVSGHDPRV